MKIAAKSILVSAVLLLFMSFARADVIYTLDVQNAPDVGTFSWTLDLPGFIEQSPDPIYVQDASSEYGWKCAEYCTPRYFDSFTAKSDPVNGGGCGIEKVWAEPGNSLITWFSPLCDGLYDATYAGGLPQPGITGSWSWTGANPYGAGLNYVTLTITDLPAVPEPSTAWLLATGLLSILIVSQIKIR